MVIIKIGTEEFDVNYLYQETSFGIVYDNDSFYLLKDEYNYSLIGGIINPNETTEEALKRIFLNDVNGNIIIKEKLCIIDCYWTSQDKKPMHSISHIFIVNITNMRDCNYLMTLNKDNILNNLSFPYQYEAIKYYIKEKL